MPFAPTTSIIAATIGHVADVLLLLVYLEANIKRSQVSLPLPEANNDSNHVQSLVLSYGSYYFAIFSCIPILALLHHRKSTLLICLIECLIRQIRPINLPPLDSLIRVELVQHWHTIWLVFQICCLSLPIVTLITSALILTIIHV